MEVARVVEGMESKRRSGILMLPTLFVIYVISLQPLFGRIK
jgi:hypothetical protein